MDLPHIHHWTESDVYPFTLVLGSHRFAAETEQCPVPSAMKYVRILLMGIVTYIR